MLLCFCTATQTGKADAVTATCLPDNGLCMCKLGDHCWLHVAENGQFLAAHTQSASLSRIKGFPDAFLDVLTRIMKHTLCLLLSFLVKLVNIHTCMLQHIKQTYGATRPSRPMITVLGAQSWAAVLPLRMQQTRNCPTSSTWEECRS